MDATMDYANLDAANLRNAYLHRVMGLAKATVGWRTSYNEWTVFPLGYIPSPANAAHTLARTCR